MGHFKPINDDHAVESVAFQMILNAPLGAEIFTLAQANHHLWREELPASNTSAGEPASLVPPFAFASSAIFSYVRPDGTPAWQLRFESQMITVSCGRYTRWEKVWSTAHSIIDRALQVIRQAPSSAGNHVAAIRLQVTDKFEAEEADWNPAGLFRRNGGLLPDFVFDAGPIWHNNIGWFEPSQDDVTLNNLSAATVRVMEEGISPALIGVTITHLQEARMAAPLPIEDAGTISGKLDATMARLHSRNKARISNLLVDEICSMIGLSAMKNVEVEI